MDVLEGDTDIWFEAFPLPGGYRLISPQLLAEVAGVYLIGPVAEGPAVTRLVTLDTGIRPRGGQEPLSFVLGKMRAGDQNLSGKRICLQGSCTGRCEPNGWTTGQGPVKLTGCSCLLISVRSASLLEKASWIVTIIGFGLVILQLILYWFGRQFPLQIRAIGETALTQVGPPKVEVLRLKVEFRSRTRDTQTVRELPLFEAPNLWHRLWPRWYYKNYDATPPILFEPFSDRRTRCYGKGRDLSRQ